MALVSGPLLFCEGKPGSYDNLILSRLKRDIPGLTIQPARGKQGIRPFAKGRLVTSEKQPYLIFRDRDFDREPGDQAHLIAYKDHEYLSYRACIENYFLDPDLIHSWWHSVYQENPNWSAGQSPGSSEIAQSLENGARRIVHYQTARWALAGMKAPAARWPEIRTSWTKKSGKLPASMEETDCRSEGLKLIEALRS